MKTINTHMKRMTVAASFLMAAMLLLMTGCKEDTPASLYNPPIKSGPQPVVESVVSSHGTVVFGGLSQLTITGQNFSSNPAEDQVFLDAVKAPLVQASPTQLVVNVPLYLKDSVRLVVTVQGAALFSEVKYVNIVPAVSNYGGFSATEEPVGIAGDNSGNLYVSLKVAGAGAGIRKYYVGPDTGSAFAPAGGVTAWSGLKVGPGGALFGARNIRALSTIPAGAANVVWAQASGASLVDIDFDNHGYLWAVGNNANVYRFTVATKSVTPYAFTANLRTVRVFNGYLYVGGKKDSTEAVWRFPLNADGSLGASELFFDLTAATGNKAAVVNAITFNSIGEMYLATNQIADPMLLVASDGKSSQTYYPGLITGPLISLAWGPGSTLFAARGGVDATTSTVKTIIKITTLKASAPYYGLQ